MPGGELAPPAPKRVRLDRDALGGELVAPAAPMAPVAAPAAPSVPDPWVTCDPATWPPVLNTLFFLGLERAVTRLYPFTSETLWARRAECLRDIESHCEVRVYGLPADHATGVAWIQYIHGVFAQLENIWLGSPDFLAAEAARCAGRGDVAPTTPPAIAEGRAAAFAAAKKGQGGGQCGARSGCGSGQAAKASTSGKGGKGGKR